MVKKLLGTFLDVNVFAHHRKGHYFLEYLLHDVHICVPSKVLVLVCNKVGYSSMTFSTSLIELTITNTLSSCIPIKYIFSKMLFAFPVASIMSSIKCFAFFLNSESSSPNIQMRLCETSFQESSISVGSMIENVYLYSQRAIILIFLFFPEKRQESIWKNFLMSDMMRDLCFFIYELSQTSSSQSGISMSVSTRILIFIISKLQIFYSQNLEILASSIDNLFAMFRRNQVADDATNQQIKVISLAEKKVDLKENQQITNQPLDDQVTENCTSITCMGPFCSDNQDIGIIVFLFLVTSCVANSAEVIYVMDPEGYIDVINIAFITTSVPRIIFFTAVGIKLAGCRKFFFYWVLLDPISFPMGLAVYAYIVFLVTIFQLAILDYISMVLLVLQFTTFAGCHRALVAEANWRKWQILLYKFGLCGAAGAYIIWGIRYIFPGVDWTGGEDPEIDGAIKQFMILYIIGSADFVVKLFEKVCDLDKTANLKIDEQPFNSIIRLE